MLTSLILNFFLSLNSFKPFFFCQVRAVCLCCTITPFFASLWRNFLFALLRETSFQIFFCLKQCRTHRFSCTLAHFCTQIHFVSMTLLRSIFAFFYSLFRSTQKLSNFLMHFTGISFFTNHTLCNVNFYILPNDQL